MRRFVYHIALLFYFVCGFVLCGKSQDIHFSQFQAAPMNLNPALAGNFTGDMRLIGNYRDQWRTVTVPFQTFGVSADVNGQEFFGIANSGGGISVYNDIAGDSRFNTFQLNFTGSYTIPFNRNFSRYLSMGLQAGFTQRRLNYDALKFDSQYDPETGYDPGAGHGEVFDRASRYYPNVNLGLYYHHKINDYQTYNFGLSTYNITKPGQSYFDNPDIGLDRRFNFHVDGNIYVNDDWDFLPALLLMNQGTYFELTAGGSMKYALSESFEETQQNIYYGLYSRIGDAAYLQFGYEHGNWRAGVSFDFNYSGLVPASYGIGGPEFSFVYILDALFYHREHYQICPEFL